MTESNRILDIKIISDNGMNIFSVDKYIIPLYQRAFTWEKKGEIEQIIDDILNFETDSYYLGNIIVHERDDGKLEVIDGQQRLTVLYLLLTALKIPFDKNALSFEHRKKSDDTLAKLNANDQTNWRQSADTGILAGYDFIAKKIIRNVDDTSEILIKDELKKKLENVGLVRVSVPPKTDLNKYFEIMNNRGEQLEQQDIVKSQLIGMLDKKKHDGFTGIWEACSDMNGYIQMNFLPEERKHYFGNEWDACPGDSKGYFPLKETDRTEGKRINDIIGAMDGSDLPSTEKKDGPALVKDEIRFESFILFRHFLLHVLKIFEAAEKRIDPSQNEWSGELIDDKKLIKRFEKVFPERHTKSKKVERFGLCLLRCRFLFDQYMLKREFCGDDKEGKWSLKKLKSYWSNDKKRGKKYATADYVNVENSITSRMLQSMLRVTYTSPLGMHWVTEFLAWLYFDMPDYDSNEAAEKLENIAKTAVRRYMENKKYTSSAGLKTHRIVLNYLDYLLWQEEKSKSDFQFEFRNSIEHWYPQDPIDGNIKWEESALHHFGNLCLVSSEINSKFSNNLPLAKKGNFKDGIKKQSLKLQKMADATTEADGWTKGKAIAHGDEMIAKIKDVLKSN